MLFDFNSKSVVLALGTESGAIGFQSTVSKNDLIF